MKAIRLAAIAALFAVPALAQTQTPPRDIAARVIPRIKDTSETESKLPKGGLPDLLPLLDGD